MRNINMWSVLIIVMMAMIILGIFCGCYTDKVATRNVTKALLYKPAIVAKICRDAFPCVTTKLDTLIVTKDTMISVDCPTIKAFISPKSRAVIHDTLNQQVLVKLPIKTVYITRTIEDSAKIKVLQSANDLLKVNVQTLNIDVITLKAKVRKKNIALLSLIFFIATCLSATIYFKIKQYYK